MILSAVTRSTISDNIFDDVSDGGTTGLGGIRVSFGSDSNTITGNHFVRMKGGAALYLNTDADRNRVVDNHFWHWVTTPWVDIGSDNIIGPNIVAGALNGFVPKTNTFSGTNVVIDLARHPVQVVEVTNTCLLIITNTASTAFHSGKQVTVTLYNNKATNVGVYMTAVNRRPLGQDVVSMATLAATHTSLTNGQSARLEFEVHGTNYSVLANHQR